MPNTVTRFALDHVPQERRRRQRRAVVEHHGGPHGQAGDQPVPHHPAAGGEVEDPILAAEIGVQHQLLQMLKQRPPRTVHHAFGESCRAGGVHDVDGVVEGGSGGRRYAVAEAAVPAFTTVPPFRRSAQSSHSTAPGMAEMSGRSATYGTTTTRSISGIRSRTSADPLERVNLLSGIAVAVGAEEHPRDESGRSGRATPLAPKSGEQDDQIAPRLVVASMAMMVSGRLGRKPATRSPGRIPWRPQRPATRATSRPQLGIAELALAALLVPEDDGRMSVGITQKVFREVEPGAGEPARAELRGPAAPSDRARGQRHPKAARPGRSSAITPQNPHTSGQKRPGAFDRPAVKRGEVADVLASRPVFVF